MSGHNIVKSVFLNFYFITNGYYAYTYTQWNCNTKSNPAVSVLFAHMGRGHIVHLEPQVHVLLMDNIPLLKKNPQSY